MFKWFLVLILIRPIIDNFYFVKDISPLLSPLNWVGVLTPVLCIPAISTHSYHKNFIHQLFNFWSILIIINTALIIFQPLNFITIIQLILKLSLPVYLFAFLRTFIRNKTDLTGILTTFLYSCGLAFVVLMFELIVRPIRIEYSRGIERLQGGYADVMNYAIYLSFGFLILAYFYLSHKLTKTGLKIKLPFLIFSGVFCMFGYVSISHAVSYTVFAFLLILFIAYTARKYIFISIFLIAIGWTALSFYGNKFYQERVSPLVEKEIEVVQGERDKSQLFHGRMYRWEYAWKNFKDSNLIAWLFGYPTTFKDPVFNISIGIHNDFLRIFYLTGLAGLSSFMLFIFKLWGKRKFLILEDRLLLSGALIILILYSITTTPTFYPNFLYILLPIFTYLALPPALLMNHGEK